MIHHPRYPDGDHPPLHYQTPQATCKPSIHLLGGLKLQEYFDSGSNLFALSARSNSPMDRGQPFSPLTSLPSKRHSHLVQQLLFVASLLFFLPHHSHGFGPNRVGTRQSTPSSEALSNDQVSQLGFWRDTTPPSLMRQPYPSFPLASSPNLALNTPACLSLRQRMGCSRVESADLILDMGDSETRGLLNLVYDNHPQRNHLVVERVGSLSETRSAINRFILSCKVIRHLLIISHGWNGLMAFSFERDGVSDAAETPSVRQFLIESGMSCALAPEARIQFSACLAACRHSGGSTAQVLTETIQNLVQSPVYRTVDGTNPFRGVRLLFNSNMGVLRSSQDQIHSLRPIGPYSFGDLRDQPFMITIDSSARILSTPSIDRLPTCSTEL